MLNIKKWINNNKPGSRGHEQKKMNSPSQHWQKQTLPVDVRNSCGKIDQLPRRGLIPRLSLTVQPSGSPALPLGMGSRLLTEAHQALSSAFCPALWPSCLISRRYSSHSGFYFLFYCVSSSSSNTSVLPLTSWLLPTLSPVPPTQQPQTKQSPHASLTGALFALCSHCMFTFVASTGQ